MCHRVKVKVEVKPSSSNGGRRIVPFPMPGDGAHGLLIGMIIHYHHSVHLDFSRFGFICGRKALKITPGRKMVLAQLTHQNISNFGFIRGRKSVENHIGSHNGTSPTHPE